MKTILITRPVNPNLLTEELFDRFPDWVRPHPSKPEIKITEVNVSSREIVFPDDTSEEDVMAVVDAHDETRESKNQTKKKEKEKDRKEAIKKLKDLGLTDEEIEAIICP